MKITNFEHTEPNVCRLTLAATAEELEAAIQNVYEEQRPNVELEGYEKGQADRAAIQAVHGESVFWYDAINLVMENEAAALVEQVITEKQLPVLGEISYDLVSAATEEGFVATASFVTEPDITLEQYTGFSARCNPSKVTEKDVEHFIARRRTAMAELVPHNGPAVKGNIVHLTYLGFVDGHVFEGGKATKQRIQLGVGQIIPGFEEAILGHRAGDVFDINVTFPANYGEPSLAGKPAVFKAKLEDVCLRHIPSLNSDFAKRAGNVASMEEYRALVRKQLEEMRLENAMNRTKTELVRQLAGQSSGELPHMLTDNAYMLQLQQFQTQLAEMRKPLDQYLQETGQTKEQLLAQLRKVAEDQMRVRLALLKIARIEKLQPTDEEVEQRLVLEAAKVRKTLADYRKGVSNRTMYQDMCAERAAEFVVAHSNIIYV
ncbi:MAG: trigger factor [Faecalibacterium sp.]|nr:trigger factor [Faecalibacterium sp.]